MAKGRLGRGMSALLGEEPETLGPSHKSGNRPVETKPVKAERSGEVLLPLEKLLANPGQPRKNFDQALLEELAASIKEHGIIEPIIADEAADGNYLIIAGERRSRAAKLAGLKEVPAIIRRYSGEKRLEIALVENIQRTDLNPIEEAAAYKRLMETTGLSQDETAARVGKNRSTVANALRLLKLPAPMQEALEAGNLSAGHARAILSLSRGGDQEKLFKEITGKGLSVRAAEQRAAELAGTGKNSGGKTAESRDRRDPELKAMEEKLIETLGTKAVINGGLQKGHIEIEYYSMDDLDRVYRLLTGG